MLLFGLSLYFPPELSFLDFSFNLKDEETSDSRRLRDLMSFVANKGLLSLKVSLGFTYEESLREWLKAPDLVFLSFPACSVLNADSVLEFISLFISSDLSTLLEPPF